MASDLEQTLKRIGEKSRFLSDRYKVVVGQLDEAIARIAELEKKVDKQRMTIQTLEQQLEYLTLAATVAPNRETLDQTRAMITELVRDIDRCIADLKS